MDQFIGDIGVHSFLAKAPGNPLIWRGFLASLTEQLNSDSSALLVTDLAKQENTHFLYSSDISDEYQDKYHKQLNKQDKFNCFISKNPGKVFCNQNSIIDYCNETVTQFPSPEHQCYRFGVSIPCNQQYSLNLLINRKTVFNDWEQSQITQVLDALIFSLEKAVHEECQVKMKSQLIDYLGNQFDEYLIIDRELNILFADPVYISIISQLDCVDISADRFAMKCPKIEMRLLSYIKKNEGLISVHKQCHSCQISLIPITHLKNLYQWECFKDSFVLTFTHDKANNPALERLRKLYQLSQCEATCAMHFMQTPSISEIADNLCRSQDTVRNHMKHIMHKMEVHSQAELMKKLITLLAL